MKKMKNEKKTEKNGEKTEGNPSLLSAIAGHGGITSEEHVPSRNFGGHGTVHLLGPEKKPRRTSTLSQAKFQPGMSVPAQLQPLRQLTIFVCSWEAHRRSSRYVTNKGS